jgi:SAM-dependent methyltransferase
MKTIRHRLKQIPALKAAVIVGRTFKQKMGTLKRISLLHSFYKDFRSYRTLERNPNFNVDTKDLFPRIYDKTSAHSIDPVYFIQGCWCARKVFEHNPTKHIDIGSQAIMVGIISQFVPTTMVDIRPLTISLAGLSFVEGDIIHLPFADNSVESLSSICVIEHIGLGRYGDPLDQFGSEKSARELVRVLAKGGRLYISVPVDSSNKTYFNAHRAFTREYLISLFNGLKLIEEKYIYGNDLVETYDPEKGFGTGLYAFQK